MHAAPVVMLKAAQLAFRAPIARNPDADTSGVERPRPGSTRGEIIHDHGRDL